MTFPLAPGQMRALVRRLEFAAEPLALFRALTDGGRRPHTILLESAEPGSRRTQRSLLVTSSALAATCRGEEVTISALGSNGATLLPFLAGRLERYAPTLDADRLSLRFPPAPTRGGDRERLLAPSVLTALRELAFSPRSASPEVPETVFLAGLFAYDLVERFERLPRYTAGSCGADAVVPDYLMYLAERLVIVDHLRQRTDVIAIAFGGEHAAASRESAERAVASIADAAAHSPRDGSVPTAVAPSADITVDRDDDAFAATVASLQRHITAGDVFQVVPSRTFSLPCTDALTAYERLRTLNPSPYLFFANTEAFALFGASPESAVKVDGRSRSVEISPIAGTRPRGLAAAGKVDAELDARHEAELRLDAKENAEHMMLVDLARNDVARVSRPGTRHVAELLRVERYSHVMHLVSRVRGELVDGLDALHAYQASMNMGTLTGAPKLRAMELLRAHEPSRRGHYGGAIGYLLGDGSFDTAIVIRAALVRNGVAHVRAGAGVVHDSVPALEAEETRRKAEAVLRAIAEANVAAPAAAEAAHVA